MLERSLPTPLQEAERDAARSAARADVVLRELHDPSVMIEASALLASVWKLEPHRVHIDPGLLVALAHAGNYVVGAYRGDRLVGVCVGFFAEPLGTRLQSHIAGVVPELSGSGVGQALKLHQRAWGLERGLRTIAWTFDPLISRNAYLNIHRLGAAAEEYLVDFYGVMTDGVNRGQASDRMLVVWDIAAGSRPVPVPEPRAGDAALSIGDDGGPVRGSVLTEYCTVAVPRDIEALRLTDAGMAARWRLVLRDTLGTLLDGGWRVIDFARSSHYVLRRESL